MSVLPSSPPPVTGSDPRLLLLHLCPHSPHSYSAPTFMTSLLVLNPLGISPWPLYSPIPLCGAASPGLPEPLPLPRICSTPSEQSPPRPVWTHFPALVSIPLSSFLFLLVLSTFTEVNFPYCPSPPWREALGALFPHG